MGNEKLRCVRIGVFWLYRVVGKEQFEEFHTFSKGGNGDVFIHRVAAGALGGGHPHGSEPDGVLRQGVEVAAVGATHDEIGGDAHVGEVLTDALGQIGVFPGVDVGYRGSIPGHQHFQLQIIFVGVPLQHRQGSIAALVDGGPQVCHQVGLLGDHIGGIGAAHLCKAAGGGHDGFAEGRNLGHQHLDKGLEDAEIAQHGFQRLGEGGTHGTEHFLCFRQDLLFKGALALDLVGEGKEPGGGGVPGRGAGVAALTPGGDLHIHVALFRNADHGVGLVHAVHGLVHNGAALVNDHGQPDALLLQVPDDGCRAVAAGLLVDGESQIHIGLGGEAFCDQLLHGLHLHEHGALAVQGAPAVEVAVNNGAAVCRDDPAFVGGGDHILVAHQQNGQSGAVRALPQVQQAAPENGLFQLFVQQRKQLLQTFMEAVEIGQVLPITEGKLPTSYYYTLGKAYAMSANFPVGNRIKSKEGKVVDIKETPKGFFVTVEFEE